MSRKKHTTNSFALLADSALFFSFFFLRVSECVCVYRRGLWFFLSPPFYHFFLSLCLHFNGFLIKIDFLCRLLQRHIYCWRFIHINTAIVHFFRNGFFSLSHSAKALFYFFFFSFCCKKCFSLTRKFAKSQSYERKKKKLLRTEEVQNERGTSKIRRERKNRKSDKMTVEEI